MLLAGMIGGVQAQNSATNTTKDSETTLPKITVKDKKDRESKSYQTEKSRIGKVNQEVKDIPQSITIVPEKLIHDRQADTFKEALRNVAAITFNAGEGGRIGDNITIRGYSAVGDLYLDGMRDLAQYNRETFNLEQIEVLKGAASMLYGRGSTGGLINQVSKSPVFYDKNEVKFTVGSNNYKRLTVDTNQVINDDVAIRLNAMKTDTDSFRNGVEQHRQGIAPSIKWRVGNKNEVQLSYFYLEEDNIPDFGVPYFRGAPVNVPVSNFYGLKSDYEQNRTKIATASYLHRFSNDTEVKTILRQGNYHRDLRVSVPRLSGNPTVLNDNTLVARNRSSRAANEDYLTSQTDFTTKLSGLGLKHQILAGIELSREKGSRWNNTSSAAQTPNTRLYYPDNNPILPANLDASFQVTGVVHYESLTTGIYAQDTIQFAKDWKVVLGARYDKFKATYDRPQPQGDLQRKDGVWSYRSGLLYQPTEAQTYYLAYGTSFSPSADLYSLDDRGANTPPEKNRNMELGAKWELLEGDLSFRSAIFRTEKTNERNTDLAVSIEQNLLSGKRHTDGIEFELNGRITPKWDIFAASAFMRANIDAATGQQANTLNKTPVNTPSYTHALWSTYKMGGGWKVGLGAERVGNRQVNTTNTTQLPAYTRYDGLVEYAYQQYSVKLNVFNLLNKDYYEGLYTGHTVPGTKRAAQVTFGVKF
ncbi:TonB-dependent siderophore receptor [Parvibium lacunae]|uniref:TonB-dependent siderophore receptor n=2 Tax=Parvibium lacunae TaxID=1888893 RepID=A0A368L6B7_9BURK|nr:TonB-dependent siderophore receptor [Parvibium lacunae]